MELNFLETLKIIYTNHLTKYNSNTTKKRYLFLNDPEKLYDNIQQLPSQLQNKLYIMCMKGFWKQYIPETAKVPIWYTSAIRQQKILFNAMQNNIHFMHLSCNTLEENKTYILGCQCSYCYSYGLDRGHEGTISENKYNHRSSMEEEYINDSDYFINTIPNGKSSSKWNSRWKWICSINEEGDVTNITMGLKIFNPGEDLFLTLKDRINGDPIYFKPFDM